MSSSSFEKKNRGFLGPRSEALATNELRAREELRLDIDGNGFNWHVWAVAASGFFTDSYNLFATNVILPSIAYVYWQTDENPWRETFINAMTLGGSAIGQLLFGILADVKGRNSLYGVELVIVIFSTIGVASASSGIGNNMSILAWLVAWRFVMGIGIGAEYPLSAVICSEWSSTKARARMMSAVFFMQPVGQLLAQLVGLWVVLGRKSHLQSHCSNDESNQLCRAEVDRIWRIVTGVGAAPALLAIIFRFLIWDAGLYVWEVKQDIPRAIRNSQNVYPNIRARAELGTARLMSGWNVEQTEEESMPIQFSREDLRYYFIEQGNWRYLAGTSICWFLLDFAFYGLGMNNPRTIAKIFANAPVNENIIIPSWNTNPQDPDATIYDTLKTNAERSIYTVCIASLAGSALFIFFSNYIRRRNWLIGSFLVQGLVFIISGGTFYAVFHKGSHFETVALVAICHFLFNFGANTLTFMIPAEIFPSTYRCTCHGISAASGKIGSIVVSLVLRKVGVGSDPNTNALGYVFIIFGVVMAIGAFFAWAWIPDVQNGREEEGGLFKFLKPLQNKTLEELGEGLARADQSGQRIGFRNKLLGLKRRTFRKGSVYTSHVEMS
ncbi:uncharacterized protein PV09_07726 [Verruconis gallopava]|uniref:Major facilitator superfamily (MFS) profile domain-containing protein n=1 Tax=Verruconis gallopava TaxID=253628 RepID=A0A0D1YIP5_9PEZI|nr:uncharacterized protein PV09_07726 [Verruconis gallopava]KIW00742.1 hypothetical protein PV09_07726 [Verruconis gallopava]